MIGAPKNHDLLLGVKNVVAVFFVSVAVKVIEPNPRLWPCGLASPVRATERPKYSNVDFDNDTMQGKRE
jgi:hypothetical protein